MRSLYAAVSGLQAEQTAMDVIANNISNVSTPGFKASRAEFGNLFEQLLQGGTAPTPSTGGSNPSSIGLGVNVEAVQSLMGQGTLAQTGINTDLAVQGNGFFVVQTPTGQAFTRAGGFQLDANGDLVTPTGYLVQGWQASAAGKLPAENPSTIGSLQIQQGLSAPAQATSDVQLGGDLNSAAATGTTAVEQVDVYDSQGNVIPVTLTFTADGGNAWGVTAVQAPVTGTTTSTTLTVSSPTVQFNGSGQITSSTLLTLSGFTGVGGTNQPTLGGTGNTVVVDVSAIGGFNEPSSLNPLGNDGHGAGTLSNFTIDGTGTITGEFSNGSKMTLGQIALAGFSNDAGLQAQQDGTFTVTNNSGTAAIGTAGAGGLGTIQAGSLEQSNVDLGQEFTNMVTTQRAYQADAQVITTSAQMLQTLATMAQSA